MKTKNIVTVLLVAVILTSCAPAAKVVPTETAVSTSTFTPAPPTITPTFVPENIADAKDLSVWVSDFVHAYDNKVTVNGIEMDATHLTDEIRKTGDKFIQVKKVKGIEFSFLVVNNVPLAIRSNNENWREILIKDLTEKFPTEFSIGISYDGREKDLAEKGEFSIVVAGPFIFTEKENPIGLDLLSELETLTKNNNLVYYGPHLYYHWLFSKDQNPKLAYLNSADKVTIENWMILRAKDLFTLAPNIKIINVSNEPIYEDSGAIGWENSPMYKAFGKDWLKKAWQIAYQESNNANIHDIVFVFNDYNNEWENLKSQYYRNFGKEFKQELELQNINLTTPFAIGMQFHVRTGAQDKISWWGPHIDQIKYETLLQHFESFKGIAPIYITEFSVKGENDVDVPVDQQIEVVNTVVQAALDSNNVRAFIFWEPLNHPFLFDPSTGKRLMPYYALVKTLYEYVP
ncbi:MAG: endo-1,4-beta-xylanase [Chloroflexota bacterium]